LTNAKIAFPLQWVDVHPDDDGALLVCPGDRASYRVNAVGSFIAQHLQEPVPVNDLRERIAASFHVDDQSCAEAVEGFLSTLHALALVDVVDQDPSDSTLRRRYIDLLKKAVSNLIYPEVDLRYEHLEKHGNHDLRTGAHERHIRDIRYIEAETFEEVMEHKRLGTVRNGLPTRFSHTMIGLRRLDNLDYCATRIFADRIPGDFLEAGVCQGGASIFLRGMQVAHGEEGRKTWVADSFRGLPPPHTEIDRAEDLYWTEARFPWLSMSLRTVRDNFRTYDLLSDNVRFLEGWFADTLPDAPIDQLALLRLDGDLYSSTMDVLTHLYDKVSPGGFVVIDDYGAIAACRKAVTDFRDERGIREPVRRIDWTGAYWRKAL
jgi:hypothetical protein